ncbi:MAG: PIN domain-containing protein [Nanobdellota archaeon]
MEGIILDTNFLMIPVTQNVDVFTELGRVCDFPYKLYIVDKSLDELDKIAETDKKAHMRRSASLARQVMERQEIEVIETSERGYVDDIIVNKALEKGYRVATQDKGLKRKLKQKGIPIIYLRQKNYLVVE